LGRRPPYTLKVMTVVAIVMVPVVVIYQAWAYHIFRARLTAPKVGTDDGARVMAETT
jgi:cytochrome d ubiquinol oxidase subunit II